MSEHVLEWIGAYHDGELSGALRDTVEAHLTACLTCRRELEELRALSALLQADPLPAALMAAPAAQTAAQVMRRLPPAQPPFWRAAAQVGWRYAPAALFCVWAFFQSVIWVSGALLLVLPVLPGGGDRLAALSGGTTSPLLSLLSIGLPLPGLGDLVVLAGLPWLNMLVLFNIVIIVLLAVLFLAWLAGTWAYKRRDLVMEDYYGPHSHLTSSI